MTNMPKQDVVLKLIEWDVETFNVCDFNFGDTKRRVSQIVNIMTGYSLGALSSEDFKEIEGYVEGGIKVYIGGGDWG